MKKRRQHYVWRYYLRAWSQDEKIFCLRDGAIFSSNLMGVANKRDFYKIRELDENDIEFVKRFAIEQSTPYLKEVHLRTLNSFALVFKAKKFLESSGKDDPELNKEIDELINNFEEDFHGEIEKSSIKFINYILEEKIDFYQDKEERVGFLCFLCFQYFRTNKIKANMISNICSSGIPENWCMHFEKTYNIFSHVFAYNVAYSLAMDSGFKILPIKNNSSISLITCDQPVINTFSVGSSPRKMVDKLELYYPVSPKMAILITEKAKYPNIDALTINESSKIHDYNLLMIAASHEQIYSNSKDLLEAYKCQIT